MMRTDILVVVFFVAAPWVWAQTPQKHHYDKQLFVPLVEPKLDTNVAPKHSKSKRNENIPQSKAKTLLDTTTLESKAKQSIETIPNFEVSRNAQKEGIVFYEKKDWLNAFRCFKKALEHRSGDANSKYAMDQSIEKLVASGGAYAPKLQNEIKEAKLIKAHYNCPKFLRYCAGHVATNKFLYSLSRRFESTISIFNIEADKPVTLKYDINFDPRKEIISVYKSSGDAIQDKKVLEAFKLAMPFLRSFWLDINEVEITNNTWTIQNPPLRTPEIVALENQKDRCLTFFKRGKLLFENKKYREAIIDFQSAKQCALPAFKYIVEQMLADSYYYYAVRIEEENPRLAKEYLERVKILQPERMTSY